MELFGFLGGIGSTAAGYIIPFLFVLTVVVFFHELGHFLVARWCGVTVKVFSIGFGPELFGFFDRKGTRWKLSAIPLGGYVKFLGDEDEAGRPDREEIGRLSAEERRHAFADKSVGARAAIVAAGPVANFILAIAIFTAIFSIYGRQVTSARVDVVVADSAAERAGFVPGDLIVSIDGRPIGSFSDLQRVVSASPGAELDVVVTRDGQPVSLKATPEYKDIPDGFNGKQRIAVLGIQHSASADDIVTERFSVLQAFGLAVSETWFVTERSLSYLFGVISGRESADQLGGPIRVAEVSGQVATLGLVALINLAAVLSISIGMINLFPVPMLDGGHLLFFAVEAVRGRPLSEKAQDIGFRIGFAAVLMLMIFATWNDIIHLSSL
ncbi:MAG: RIP metalloprotease RseP [Bauldia sp.]|nr:MAG: RIP metalloprotease RseP [Bauldia sp.]